MKPRKFHGRMENGKLKAEGLRLYLAELDGEAVEITVKPSKEYKRTIPQNSYIHWMFRFIANCLRDLGNEWTEEEVKHWLKMTHLTYHKHTPDGENVLMCKDTSELDDAECAVFMEACWRTCAEIGIVVPAPGEQMELV
jgi:hypothetical protein